MTLFACKVDHSFGALGFQVVGVCLNIGFFRAPVRGIPEISISVLYLLDTGSSSQSPVGFDIVA